MSSVSSLVSDSTTDSFVLSDVVAQRQDNPVGHDGTSPNEIPIFVPNQFSSKKASGTTRSRASGRVPRPRNAFMIFRSEFWTSDKIKPTVEHDNRQISRIIGHCWNEMPEEQKDYWRIRAENEKLEHSRKYPDYRFIPTARTKKAVKRKTNRNTDDDILRCRRVAELLLEGKEGDELVSAVGEIYPTALGSGVRPPDGASPSPTPQEPSPGPPHTPFTPSTEPTAYPSSESSVGTPKVRLP